ncbi:hypothetical protein DFH07DRAFT_766456 [Mycena maculata]|uniref:Uncharacterized protein n=1 Tax=Mycena maculata TaxID=230809 RepID=A0AAD7NWD2_9AGAR|nr:hypothetical protein DFH07DRAFT_766456 [Mycena maculata]
MQEPAGHAGRRVVERCGFAATSEADVETCNLPIFKWHGVVLALGVSPPSFTVSPTMGRPPASSRAKDRRGEAEEHSHQIGAQTELVKANSGLFWLVFWSLQTTSCKISCINSGRTPSGVLCLTQGQAITSVFAIFLLSFLDGQPHDHLDSRLETWQLVQFVAGPRNNGSDTSDSLVCTPMGVSLRNEPGPYALPADVFAGPH